ncbi:MAG: GNAT family N-acetyltransferase [Pseudomonadota bacterium]
MPVAEIESERLVLRRLMKTDAQAIAGQISDWDVIRMLARPPYPYHLADAEAYLERAIDYPWEFAVTRRDNEALIGVAGVTGHLGYWLGKAHWGQGYMTEAATALINAYFATAKSKQIISGVFNDNPGSQAVLEKLGFSVTGHSRQFCPAREGDVDHIDMELRRATWRERQAT